MEVSEVRRRLRGAVEQARQDAAERRVRTDTAERDYEEFLTMRAVPTVHQMASALTAEGHPFEVFTPARTVRLTSERSSEEFIELALDGTVDPPVVVGRTTRGRGRRVVSAERPIRDGDPISEITEEDVLAFLLKEVVAILER